jgi:hypothetical protein
MHSSSEGGSSAACTKRHFPVHPLLAPCETEISCRWMERREGREGEGIK